MFPPTLSTRARRAHPGGGIAVWAGSKPEGPVGVDPEGKFAYVANLGSNNVSAYTIDANTGALTMVAGSPFGAGSKPVGVATCQRVGSICKPPPL